MHYYFENTKSFNGFIQNLKDNVKIDGYFIGTCYNGKQIFDYFFDNESTKIEYKEDTGKVIYSIEKGYNIDNFDYNPDNDDDSSMFGNVISVFMESIGQVIDEYLVNFDHFTDVMKKNGFELTIPKDIPSKYSHIFRNDYFGPSDRLGKFKNIIEKIPEIDQSDNDFGKYFSEARLMSNSPELQLLSSFNTYFIFKRLN